MAIQRKKDSAGRTYYINPKTGKRATQSSYKKSLKAKKTLKSHTARPGGKPSKSYCSTQGHALG